MAIKFICDCGEHFRARDEMASHPSVCPRCGASVTLPSPALAKVPTDPPPLLGPDAVHLVLPMPSPQQPARRPRWPLETCWHECLLYPLRAWFLLLYLAGGLVWLTGAAVLTLPDPPAFLGRQQWYLLGFCLLALLVLAYAGGFLQCTLSSGLAGEAGKVRWPAGNLLLVLRSAAIWLLCFLAGPVVLVAGGFLYWLHCGDVGLLDALILAELGAFAFGGWLLLLLAVAERGRILDANPLAVVRLINRVGDRLMVTALGAGVAAVAHGRLLLAGLEELHRREELGWLLLASCWLSGLFGMTFLLRLLGVWGHRAPDGAGGPRPSTSQDGPTSLPELQRP